MTEINGSERARGKVRYRRREKERKRERERERGLELLLFNCKGLSLIKTW